jgi:hypothetical protein
MKTKFFLKKWSSVSAAAAVLLGSSSRAPASIPSAVDETAKSRDKEPFEPLVLKPAATKIIPEERFAGHVSHSSHASHASHASHYSGSGAYQPYAATPAPPRPDVPAPSAAPATTGGSGGYYSAPQVPHRIELTSGKVIYGDVQVKSAAGITLRGWDGKSYKFDRSQLTARTIAELGLPEQRQSETTGTPTKPQPSNAIGIQQKNEDLEQTIRALQADNAALREQLRATATKPASTSSTQNAVQSPPTSSPAVQDASQAYWLSSTGKRHNKSCRYYGTGRGRPCGSNEGVPCKLCGG